MGVFIHIKIFWYCKIYNEYNKKKKSVLNMNIVMCETNEARKTTLEENIGHISCSLLLFAKDFYVLQNQYR